MLTLILSAYIIYVLIKVEERKKKYIYLLVLTITMEILDVRGPFFSLGQGTVISRVFVCEMVLSLYSIYYVIKGKIEFNLCLTMYVFLFLFAGFLGIIYEFIYPCENLIIDHMNELGWDGYAYGLTSKTKVIIYWPWTMLLMVKLSMALLQVLIIKTVLNFDDLLVVLEKADNYIKWAIGYVAFEFLCKFIFNIEDVSNFVSYLMFFTGDYRELRGDHVALVGCGTEPSSLARYLFINILISYFRKKYDTTYSMNMFVFTALICTAFMMIGGSMASYWLLIMLPIFIPIMKNNDKKISINKILKIFVLLFGGGAVIYLFVQEWIEMSDSYIAFRLNQIMKTIDFLLVNNDSGFKYSSDSSLARLGSVYDVFIDFSTRPIFGLGMGVETSHGGISSFLSEYGLLGMFIWIRIVFVKTRVKRVNAFFFLFWFFVMNLPLKIGNIPYDIYPIVMFEMTCLSFSHAERVVRENVKCSDSGI